MAGPVEMARHESEQVLARARAEADALLAAARAHAEALATQIESDARTRGLGQGRAEARAQAAALLAEARQIRDDAARDRREVLDALVHDVAGLAAEVARQVLQREVEQSPDDIVRLTRRLLERIESPAILRVHPTLSTVLEAEAGTLGRSVEVRPDPSVAPGGLVVESEEGVLDATVHGRLDRVTAALTEGGGTDDA